MSALAWLPIFALTGWEITGIVAAAVLLLLVVVFAVLWYAFGAEYRRYRRIKSM